MASTATSDELEDALQHFQKTLTAEQKNQLKAINAIPDADAVVSFTTELDNRNAERRSRGVATRLHRFLESIQQFSTIVDTFVSSKPSVAALVWGSIKFALLAAANFSSYFDKISALLMRIGKHCPRFTEYQLLYGTSVGLRTALCSFYATIVAFCRHAVVVFQRSGFLHLAKSFLNSFEADFGPFESQIDSKSKDVKEEIRLASIKAAYQDQQLQVIERKEQSISRKMLRLFSSKRWILLLKKAGSGD
ncbi:hypothetical protein EPUS_06399 [Endocarpon pusillum Z07020]|uniref:DUF7708 domain-containing protein n=1 Tax=Endocarpon pusillum (strain Z07020 / HMAS-L-300199) TaxID=1263415 RepID=U1HU57_ENDPU|nr:uncharacterized protein EPUS_06399 [Endocarpon pusillum Z07020]ERF74130.1 hypothetical protein EPUS_06399 [Endocarpon pusillum Z07020]